MKINIAILIILLFISSGLSEAQDSIRELVKEEKANFIGTETINKIAYPGDGNINVTYYKLNLTVTYDPNYLTGIVTVGARSAAPDLNTFFLDLYNNMTVDSVLSDGSKLGFTHSNNKLFVTLDKTLSKDSTFSVTIFYRGVPAANGFGSFVFGSHDSSTAIWSLSEPYGASDWWPCKDTPADKADSSDVWITCDTSLTGVSNGILTSVVNNGNGTHTFKWKNAYPIAQYLISVAISNYLQYTTYYKYAADDSMPIENFIYPEDFAANKIFLDKTAEMIQRLSCLCKCLARCTPLC